MAAADDYRFFAMLQGRGGRLREGFRLAELSKARTLLESMSEASASRSNLLPAVEQAKLQTLEFSLQQFEQSITILDPMGNDLDNGQGSPACP